MPGGLGPRFALEAGFLILLAAVAVYARLDATEIIIVMAAGWLLASIFEVLAARRERLYPGAVWERRVEAEPPQDEPAERPETERRLSWFRRPPEVVASPPEDVAASPSEDVGVEPQAAPTRAAKTDDEATGEIDLPQRRRWFRRNRPELQQIPEEPAPRPSARHVRLIRASTSEAAGPDERKDAEAGS